MMVYISECCLLFFCLAVDPIPPPPFLCLALVIYYAEQKTSDLRPLTLGSFGSRRRFLVVFFLVVVVVIYFYIYNIYINKVYIDYI